MSMMVSSLCAMTSSTRPSLGSACAKSRSACWISWSAQGLSVGWGGRAGRVVKLVG